MLNSGTGSEADPPKAVVVAMKRVLLALMIAFVGANASIVSPAAEVSAYDQKKQDDKKKNPTPPVVKPKGSEKPKDSPRPKDKKHD
jgi:hypothetical protein